MARDCRRCGRRHGRFPRWARAGLGGLLLYCGLIYWLVQSGQPDPWVVALCEAGADPQPRAPLEPGTDTVVAGPHADLGAVLSLMQQAAPGVSLVLDGSRLDDSRVASLAELRSVDWISLRDTAVTDAALPLLHRLRWVRYLDVSGTALTARGVARLRRALPHCMVVAE